MLTGPEDTAGLLAFAGDSLEAFRLPNGLYCHERQHGSSELRGASVRYSIMVLLGMLRLHLSGERPGVDLGELYDALRPHRSQLDVGDLGLLLWAEARMASAESTETLARLNAATADPLHVGHLEGMEVAWAVIGASQAASAGMDVGPSLERAFASMQARKSPQSPLYRHFRADRGRALLPNFATEVYTLLALCEVARGGHSATAVEDARALGDLLMALRQPDGGWPWLFHADLAVVVEPYEVYSVHQDAMAPMAFFALAEVTGDDRYAKAAVESFAWCFEGNELAVRMFDEPAHFIFRSIRRQGSAQRANLAVNAALSLARIGWRADVGGLTLERTCRPYHLGWILEAWAGRDANGRALT